MAEIALAQLHWVLVVLNHSADAEHTGVGVVVAGAVIAPIEARPLKPSANIAAFPGRSECMLIGLQPECNRIWLLTKHGAEAWRTSAVRKLGRLSMVSNQLATTTVGILDQVLTTVGHNVCVDDAAQPVSQQAIFSMGQHMLVPNQTAGLLQPFPDHLQDTSPSL